MTINNRLVSGGMPPSARNCNHRNLDPRQFLTIEWYNRSGRSMHRCDAGREWDDDDDDEKEEDRDGKKRDWRGPK